MQQHTVQTPYMVGEVHLYSAELDGGLALFDAGPPTPEGIDCLQKSVDLARLKYLFITHCHVDHYGLANYLLENSPVEVYIARTDAIKFSRHRERLEAIAAIIRGYGFSDGFVSQLRESFHKNKVFPVMPERYHLVEESAVPDQLGINWFSCPGHSQSDLVFTLGGCAFTGDILLKGIFQAPLLDIDLTTFEGRFRNYDAYCTSLLKLAQLRGLQIMPGHRHSVESVDDAILFYVTTLLERSLQLLPLKHLPMTEIVDRLFQGRLTEPFFIYLKLSEIVFMLDFIENPDLLKTSLEQIGLFAFVSERFAAVAQ